MEDVISSVDLRCLHKHLDPPWYPLRPASLRTCLLPPISDHSREDDEAVYLSPRSSCAAGLPRLCSARCASSRLLRLQRSGYGCDILRVAALCAYLQVRLSKSLCFVALGSVGALRSDSCCSVLQAGRRQSRKRVLQLVESDLLLENGRRRRQRLAWVGWPDAQACSRLQCLHLVFDRPCPSALSLSET